MNDNILPQYILGEKVEPKHNLNLQSPKDPYCGAFVHNYISGSKTSVESLFKQGRIGSHWGLMPQSFLKWDENYFVVTTMPVIPEEFLSFMFYDQSNKNRLENNISENEFIFSIKKEFDELNKKFKSQIISRNNLTPKNLQDIIFESEFPVGFLVQDDIGIRNKKESEEVRHWVAATDYIPKSDNCLQGDIIVYNPYDEFRKKLSSEHIKTHFEKGPNVFIVRGFSRNKITKILEK